MAQGRKSIDKEAITETICIRVSKKELEEIEKFSNMLEIPKTRMMRNMLLVSMEETKTLDEIGILKGVKKFIDFKNKLLKIKENQKILNV